MGSLSYILKVLADFDGTGCYCHCSWHLSFLFDRPSDIEPHSRTVRRVSRSPTRYPECLFTYSLYNFESPLHLPVSTSDCLDITDTVKPPRHEGKLYPINHPTTISIPRTPWLAVSTVNTTPSSTYATPAPFRMPLNNYQFSRFLLLYPSYSLTFPHYNPMRPQYTPI